MKHLYKNFLQDQRIYNLTEACWRRFFQRLFGPQEVPFRSFYNKHYVNGQKIYEANPVFDAYFPQQHKLVRIIQYLPEPGDLLLTGYRHQRGKCVKPLLFRYGPVRNP